MNPDHLLEQADFLLKMPTDGRPRQADLRRAISAAYYAVFHSIVRACAWEMTRSARTAARYELVYRSISHSRIQSICRQVANPSPSGAVKALQPGGFDPQLRKCASLFLELIERRHDADYSPALTVSLFAARGVLEDAKLAIAAFQQADEPDRLTFLTLLVCSVRG